MTILRRSLLRGDSTGKTSIVAQDLVGSIGGRHRSRHVEKQEVAGRKPNKLLRTNMISFCRLAKVLPNMQITRRRCERSGTCRSGVWRCRLWKSPWIA